MLELDRLSKIYKTGTFGGKEIRAVNDVSFTVGNKEIISLIGESGSGKSTIGKMILRLITKSSGKIKFNGIDISTLKGNKLKDYYREVQGVFQDPFSSYNPVFKADRVFAMIRSAYFRDVADAEWRDRVADALASVRLDPAQVLDR